MTAPIYCLRAIISSGMNRQFNVEDDDVADDDFGNDDVDVHTCGVYDPMSNQCTFIVQ